MKCFINILLLLISLSASAQLATNVTGHWQGTATYLGKQYQYRYELNQNGDSIKGQSFIGTTHKTDSALFEVKGVLNNNQLTLTPVAIVYNTASYCAAAAVLSFSESDQHSSLIGKWKGDMSFLTCPPLTSGNIAVYKSKPLKSPQPQIVNNQVKSDIAKDDLIGQALITELKKRTYYALIIGVDEYKDEDIISLDQPVKDALSLAQVLKRYYSFEAENVEVLTNPKRGEIIDALDKLSATVTEKDNVLVFFAGHGIWNDRLNQGYWLPSDARLSSKADWLSNSTLRDYLGGIHSKHTLLIADACFSGGILKERAVFENSKAILEVYKLPSRKAMTSGTLKTVPDKSVFIEYLLKNLLQNEAPLMSADQLFRSFKTAVINNSSNGQVPQYGPIAQAGDEGGDFIFLKRLE